MERSDDGHGRLPPHFIPVESRYRCNRTRLQPSRRPALSATGGHAGRSTWAACASIRRSATVATLDGTAIDLSESIMKKISIVLAFAGLAASAAAGAAVPTKLLGDPATPAQAQRTIVITPKTSYVNVTEDEVVTFVANGSTFVWNFDSGPEINSFQLNRVAPPGALDHPVTAYVARDADNYH
jgi:hypothetical protein